jgi:hypothetical protein
MTEIEVKRKSRTSAHSRTGGDLVDRQNDVCFTKMRMNNSSSSRNFEFETSPFDNGDLIDEIIPTQADHIQNKTEENILSILCVVALSNIWSIVLVTIPVMVTIGKDDLYYKYE